MNIEDILAKNGVSYKAAGKNVLIRCLNPNHEDLHPSMYVNRLNGIAYCFSCKHKLDLYTHFGEVKSVASEKLTNVKNKLESLRAVQSLQFPVGYNLIDIEYRNISLQTLRKFGAFTCNSEFWDTRIWFPLYNYDKLVAFIGRRIGSELPPKYLIYPNSVSLPILPSLPDTSKGEIIVVEGIFDLLNLWDNGITNVICLFGLGKAKYDTRFSIFKIGGVHTLIPLFDADNAGREAVHKFSNIYGKTFIIKHIEIPEGKDPGSLTSKEILNLKKVLKYEII